MLRGVRARLTATIVSLVVLTAIVLGLAAYALRRRPAPPAGPRRRPRPGPVRPVRPRRRSRPRRSTVRRGARRPSRPPSRAAGSRRSSCRSAASPCLDPATPPGRPRGDPGRASASSSPQGQIALFVAGRRRPADACDRRPGRRHRPGGLLLPGRQRRSSRPSASSGSPSRSGALVAVILVAVVAARVVARGVLAPVGRGEPRRRADRAPATCRPGCRSPRTTNSGVWADRFNRMADSLEDTILRLEAAQAQNRRFVADVAHELRTPVTALVAEASLLRRPSRRRCRPQARRTGELVDPGHRPAARSSSRT